MGGPKAEWCEGETKYAGVLTNYPQNAAHSESRRGEHILWRGWTVAMQGWEVAFGAVLSEDLFDWRQNLLRKNAPGARIDKSNNVARGARRGRRVKREAGENPARSRHCEQRAAGNEYHCSLGNGKVAGMQ